MRIIWFFSFLLSFQPAFSQIYNFRNYNIDDGLPQSQINTILQDHNGYLWFGTNGGGLGKFDGKRFQIYNNESGLTGNQINTLFEDSDGIIWIGTEDGLCSYNGTEFNSYKTRVEEESNYILNITSDGGGNLFIGNSKGILKFDGKKFIDFPLKNDLKGLYITSSYKDLNGSVWFGTAGHGVFRMNKSGMQKFGEQEGIRDQFINTISQDANGNLLAGTNNGIFIFMDGRFSPWRENEIFGGKLIKKIFYASNNVFWIGTQNGIFLSNSKTTIEFRQENGLVNDDINSIYEDREGLIWIATSSGISKFDNQKFVSYSPFHNSKSNIITYIFQDSDKKFWFGSWNNGVSSYSGNNFRNYNFPEFPSKKQVSSIIEVRSREIWISTLGDGIFVYDGKVFKKLLEPEGISFQFARHLFKDSRERIWISTNGNGVFLYENGVYTKFGREDGLLSDYIYSVSEDRNHHIWICLSNGITKYDGNQFKNYSIKSGLLGREVVQAIADSRNTIWLATEKGLYYSRNQKFEAFTMADGLLSDQITSLGIEEGKLILGTIKGLMVINLIEFYKTGKLALRKFTKDEGFMGVECSQNSIFRDLEGNFWIGTIKGVTCFNPSLDYNNKVLPKTHISRVELFFENINWKDYTDSIDLKTSLPHDLKLEYYNNHLTFQYTGISNTVPEKVKYKFFLVGFDKEWSPETNRKDAVYSNIPPGKYNFKVIASNNDGAWNNVPSEFSFTVLAPFWKTWWFYLICFGGITLFIYALIFFRERNLLEQRFALEEKVNKRTRQLNDEKGIVEKQNEVINKKNKDITDSINYAKRIQESILPPFEKITRFFPDSFILFKPRDIVSGDFYWFNKKNRKAIIGAIDCTGHGVPGAFMSMIGNTLLNEIVNERNIIRPDLILTQLNLGIKKVLTQNEAEFQSRDGMDVSICAVDLDERYLEFAGANQNLYIVSGQNVETIKGDIYSIGGIEPEGSLFTNHRVDIKNDTCIYLQTDGFEDQFGDMEKKKFLSQRYKNLLLEINRLEMGRQKMFIEQAFIDWKGSQRQVDDILIIGIRF